MTGEGDLVLVYMENNATFFARIEAITPDVKPDWYHVKMLVLQVPLMVITWILREAYINGVEFTMGGRPIRLEKVVAPEEEIDDLPEDVPPEKTKAPVEKPVAQEKGKVVSLFDRKKKDHSS